MQYKNLGSIGAYLQNSSKFIDISKFLKESFAKTSHATSRVVKYVVKPQIEQALGLTTALGSTAFLSYYFTGLQATDKAIGYGGVGIMSLGFALYIHGLVRWQANMKNSGRKDK